MAFEKSALSVVAYGLDFPCIPPIAFTINVRHTRGLCAMKMYHNVFRYEYLTFQTQIHLHKQYIFDTNIIQSEYAYLFPFSINAKSFYTFVCYFYTI